jgi:hypothetical protein
MFEGSFTLWTSVQLIGSLIITGGVKWVFQSFSGKALLQFITDSISSGQTTPKPTG